VVVVWVASQDVSSRKLREDWIVHVRRTVLHDTRLSTGARLTYAILRGFTGENCKEPYPKKTTLQSLVGVGEPALDGYLKELYFAELLKCSKVRTGGRWANNRYEFIEPSPYPENQGMVDPSPYPESTVTVKHRDRKNNARKLGVLRNPIIKESHY
jgi:hypothetical protein